MLTGSNGNHGKETRIVKSGACPWVTQQTSEERFRTPTPVLGAVAPRPPPWEPALTALGFRLAGRPRRGGARRLLPFAAARRGGGAAGAAGAGRRDFVEAPPPKVNPWTKNALPPVLATVNGQSPPGGSPFGIPGPGASSGDIGVPSPSGLQGPGVRHSGSW